MMSVNINSVDILIENDANRILQNINFRLEKGSVYTILGKNGSGKSTLINALTNLLDLSIYKIDATVEFNGINLLKLSDIELLRIKREKIKYVFQDPVNSFDPIKKIEYYFKMLNVSQKEIEQMFEYFLLPKSEELFKLYPYEVSGGMAQRISISLAILARPELLILDEPTAALDINISNLLCHKLKEFVLDKSSCVFLITQDIDFAEHVSDYTAHLINGTLSEFIKLS
jgi:peptide/nickel transport system ATP-binding protein